MVVGRDPRDVFMSLLNHWGNHTPEFYSVINSTPGRVGVPFPEFSGDVQATGRDWITKGWFDWEKEGYPYWGHMHHCANWWEFRALPNIKLVHYSDLLADLEGQMRDLAAYLAIEVEEERWPLVVDACTFATVKRAPEKVVGEMASLAWKGGAQTFINKAPTDVGKTSLQTKI